MLLDEDMINEASEMLRLTGVSFTKAKESILKVFNAYSDPFESWAKRAFTEEERTPLPHYIEYCEFQDNVDLKEFLEAVKPKPFKVYWQHENILPYLNKRHVVFNGGRRGGKLCF